MIKFLSRTLVFGVVLGLASSVYAQTDVTAPGDTIVAVDLDGTVGSSPAGEPVAQAIGNTTQKYLNFGEPAGANSEQNTGFIVTPTLGSGVGGTVVTGLRLFTANDSPDRDPASYILAGALSPTGPWIDISMGDLALPAGRTPGGATAIDPASPTQFSQTLSFTNTAAYTSYRLTFPTVKNSAANSMQIAEVELLGVAVPEPSTILLAVSGLISVIYAARRRRQ